MPLKFVQSCLFSLTLTVQSWCIVGVATMWLAYVTGVDYTNYLYKTIFSSHASEADHE